VKNKRREGKKGRKVQLQVKRLVRESEKENERRKERHKDTIASNG
jgi:hypothetical protein